MPSRSTIRLTHATVDLDRHEVAGPEGPKALTPLEADLLRYLADNPGRTLSREELLREVWGYAKGVDSDAVNKTVFRLRKKLGDDAQEPRHLLPVRGIGYRFDPLEPEATTQIAARAPGEQGDFVGRTAELLALAAVFEGGGRLATLWGPGGIGKTRLALRFAQGRPALWIELSGVSELVDAFRVIGRAVGAGDEADGEDLVRFLDRVALLILDNVEQLLPALATWIDRWVDRCPSLRVVTTSRTRLQLLREVVVPVDVLGEDDAAELFARRAAAAGARGATDVQLKEIARRLEGLPLAIEIAATRAGALSTDQLLERLGTIELAHGIERHLSLRRVVDSSWTLLDPEDQRALGTASVFAGGFTLEAAQEVLGQDAWLRLAALTERSLVRTAHVEAGFRYALFEHLRAYAAEWLAARPEIGADARRRHAAWCVRWFEDEIVGGASEERLARERANLVAAVEYAREHDLDLLVRIGLAYLPISFASLAIEGDPVWSAVGASVDRMAPEARARFEHVFMHLEAPHGRGDVHFDRAIAAARAAGRGDLEVGTRAGWAMLLVLAGRVEDAGPVLDGVPVEASHRTLRVRATIASVEGRPHDALGLRSRYLEEGSLTKGEALAGELDLALSLVETLRLDEARLALARFRVRHVALRPIVQAAALALEGSLAGAAGDLGSAERALRAGLRVASRQRRYPVMRAEPHAILAAVGVLRGDLDTAEADWRAAGTVGDGGFGDGLVAVVEGALIAARAGAGVALPVWEGAVRLPRLAGTHLATALAFQAVGQQAAGRAEEALATLEEVERLGRATGHAPTVELAERIRTGGPAPRLASIEHRLVHHVRGFLDTQEPTK